MEMRSRCCLWICWLTPQVVPQAVRVHAFPFPVSVIVVILVAGLVNNLIRTSFVTGDVKRYFLSTNARIKATIAAGKQCVVHCHQDVDKASVFVIAFLMQVNHLSAYEAVTLVKKVCVCV